MRRAGALHLHSWCLPAASSLHQCRLSPCTPPQHTMLAGHRPSQAYEQRPPAALAAGAEPLLAGVMTVLLLVAPRLLPSMAWATHSAAALWVLLASWAATAGGCSLAGPLLGIFGTRGAHRHAAGAGWCLLCCVLDSAFVAGTMGAGAAVNFVFRLAFGQTVAERLVRLVPAIEDVAPTRVGALSPSGALRGAPGGLRAHAATPRQL